MQEFLSKSLSSKCVACTAGGFQCQCWLGYTGDGVTSCSPSPAVNALTSEYVTEATQGPLICDVAYPLDAPGSAYDPTLTQAVRVCSTHSTASGNVH